MTACLFTREGPVAILTLNRPEARNAFDPEMMVQMTRAFTEIREDPAIRVAILTGAGDKAFCAGADLGRFITLMTGARSAETAFDHEWLAMAGRGETPFLIARDVGKPVIAAVNGHAIAGGMELLQGTDIRIACPEAKFGLQEVKWGLFPVGGSTVRLPKQIPYAKAMEILLTGDLIDAAEAHRLGFLNHVVPRAAVMERARAIAARIAANGPLAVTAIRRAVREVAHLPLADALRREGEIAAPVFASADAKEGPRAFLEKREPRFSGS